MFAAFSRANASNDDQARVLDPAQSAGVELATITEGARGATVCHKGQILFAPAVPVDAVDTLGVGDAFVSRFACRVLTGVSLAEAASDEAMYSPLICGTRGAFGHASDHPRNTRVKAQ